MMYAYRDCNYEDWYTWNNTPEMYAKKYVTKIEWSDYVSERMSLVFQMPWRHRLRARRFYLEQLIINFSG